MTHLWEMDTHWFKKPKDEYMNCTFTYKSWKDFLECKPYKLWKPYILSSWSWKTRTIEEMNEKSAALPRSKDSLRNETKKELEMLQIVFLSPDRFSGVHRVEMMIEKENEEEVRDWLKRHMPTFWTV